MKFSTEQFDELDRLLTHADSVANLMRVSEAAEDQAAMIGAAWAIADMMERARAILREARAIWKRLHRTQRERSVGLNNCRTLAILTPKTRLALASEKRDRRVAFLAVPKRRGDGN